MKNITYLFMSFMFASLLFTSCSNDDDSGYTVPDTYTFTDDDGNSTVSYDGQTARKDMLGEITTYMKTGNSGAVLDAQEMKNMFANDVNGTDYFSYSSKDLKSKTGNGRPDATNIQAYFETLMDGLAAASSGTDGEIIDGYLQSSTTGQEWVQLIEKGLMGACFHHNISTYYLGADKMNVDNTTPEDGEYFTSMEHHWDEAYGYFTDDDYDGTRFWSKYAGGSREALLGTQTALYEAFRTGRAAIAADDMDTRDEQISVIREYMELAVGGTAIYYLNKGYGNLSAGDPVGVKNHHLAEAEAFIHGLKFGGEASFSGVEIDGMMSAMSNYNNLSGEDILSIRNQIASGLGISDSDRDNL